MPNALEAPQDSHALRAAQGYYELGMIADCETTFQELPEEVRTRPDGLELAILLKLDAKEYDQALRLSDSAILHFPNAPFGFVNKAFVLHEMKRTQESLKVLEDAHLVVAVEPTAIYNRGCYLACLDRNTEAIFWVNKAIRLNPQLKDHAKEDSDLKAIRHRLELGA